MEGNDDGFVWKMNGESSNCATISTPSAGNPSESQHNFKDLPMGQWRNSVGQLSYAEIIE
ncbi:uncharacterized protein Dsimw501_GD29182, isoform A [Drosophila simulans]|uniref:Uncharacterized protein, isoform A n=1 Tax=Drosophila simulans TaxID=7240 RepID=A0A0J9RFN2_DROSI|nr:uncharacterized protein Dsimw501_GD29182, isoform A [Drosophila simulans]